MPRTIMLPRTPCAFDRELLDDLSYEPEVLLFDQLLELNEAQSLVRCRMPAHADLPLTRSQRAHPIRHPRHVNGGVIIHATGMIGFVHAYFLLGLRHRDGWVGYGTHIHRAVFRRMIVPGPPAEASCRATRVRKGKTRYFVRYALEFRQEGALCYQGDQSAVWLRVDPAASSPPDMVY
jgi:hypothetical protein